MYQVVIEKQAQKQLAKISSPDYTKIVAALKELAANPRPYGYKKLKGRPGYPDRKYNTNWWRVNNRTVYFVEN
jgi:mRNA interferase RelE/StbE